MLKPLVPLVGVMQAALGALQDLGFTIDESDLQTGIVVGSKLAGAEIRAQVTVRPLADQERPGILWIVDLTISAPGRKSLTLPKLLSARLRPGI